ncbi:CHAT domain-containing protein [Sphingomonas sp.]|uniref:CHAT domain-containing protein n=1 Tax=Sphingomonas sp. TaxID=28214 RepID=UPI0025F73A52|nr:CHAT domain-containing protein [Sphingomonas sp.]
MLRKLISGIAPIAAGLCSAASIAAAPAPIIRPSVADSFRLGSGGSSLCRVQSLAASPVSRGMFDHSYAIACRDAATPVGEIHVIRPAAKEDPLARLSAGTCEAPTQQALENAGTATAFTCEGSRAGVPLRRYVIRRRGTVYVAQGLAGYDSALALALRSIVADRVLPGEVSVAVTEAGDAAAFARVQAGSLDLDQALAEGYRRNNGGNYAEAAEFFDTLLQRRFSAADPNRRYGEYMVNRALQKSNLGEFAEADALFAEARRIPTADPVELRLRRNLEAINHLNQGRLPQALAVLATPVAPIGGIEARPGQIDPATSAAINSEGPFASELGIGTVATLTPEEKAAILDAQAISIRGSILRLQGRSAQARAAMDDMLARIAGIRDGNVSSVTRLRAQALSEIAQIDESEGNVPRAEAGLRQSLAILDSEYPGSAAVNAARARLGAFLARTNRIPEALAFYRQVVDTMIANGGATAGFEGLLAPYFTLLAQQIPANPALTANFFGAAQTLQRPGLAETQAILTRELSGGDDAASALFRQSVTLGREIERQRIVLARLATIETPSPDQLTQITGGRERLTQLQADQVGIQSRLGAFPRYRVVSGRISSLPELQQALKPGEGYWKLLVVGGRVFGFFATQTEATAWAVALDGPALDTAVDAIRESIAVTVDGRLETHPFDVVKARSLYLALAGPQAAAFPKVKHLIFEPDGAMLRLPANLLITEQAGVDRYLKRAADPRGDPFDFRGIAWLGKAIDISTSVSPRSFEDVRRTPPSTGRKTYLGLGHNAPVPPMLQLTSFSPPAPGTLDCNWPLAAWSNPISAKELLLAQKVIGTDKADVVTGAAFNDTAIRDAKDLGEYRILHFATHGLVAAPRPSCLARPALLTSFGPTASDGLLSFVEIYDLKLDADLVILSACDTAGSASVDATREAGVTSGGGRALDGLVRAFIGAGSRSVLATHWPAPDDYRATERLISGLFEAPAGTSISEALRQGQLRLMDEADTSHPYYWSAFALIGDGAQPVLRTK